MAHGEVLAVGSHGASAAAEPQPNRAVPRGRRECRDEGRGASGLASAGRREVVCLSVRAVSAAPGFAPGVGRRPFVQRALLKGGGRRSLPISPQRERLRAALRASLRAQRAPLPARPSGTSAWRLLSVLGRLVVQLYSPGPERSCQAQLSTERNMLPACFSLAVSSSSPGRAVPAQTPGPAALSSHLGQVCLLVPKWGHRTSSCLPVLEHRRKGC
ncbi:uncharacterized protein [Excalfactoria chinensis]|uniref:uncharacterized protein n=1 Tax=Excalfactoria chinensis TaxID=46218 RepID=UPI003B3A62B5